MVSSNLRTTRTLIAAQVGFAVVIGGFVVTTLLIFRPARDFSLWVDGIWQTCALAAAALLCSLRARRAGHPWLSAWTWVAGGLWLHVGARVYRTVGEWNNAGTWVYPSPASVLWLTGNVAILIGFCLVVRAQRIHAGVLVDGLLLAFGVATLIIAIGVPLLADRLGLRSGRIATLLGYPVVELCLFVTAVTVVVICRWRPPQAVWWIGTAAALAASANVSVVVQDSTGTVSVGGPVAAAWVLSNAMIGWSAGSRATDRRIAEPRTLSLVAPLAGIGVAMTVLAVGALRTVFSAAVVLALVTIVASKFRLAIALHDARRAADHALMARTDDLTGLPNRRALYAASHLVVPATVEPDERTALLLLDLDRFKDVNDSLGHAAGDELLQIVATRLVTLTRERDLLVRLGGDEFAILAPATDTDRARSLAERICDVVTGPITIDGVEVEVGASIGIAIAPMHGHDLGMLLRHADIAMYTAKNRSCTIAVYTELPSQEQRPGST